MFNVTVLKMKDIVKCLVGIIIAVAFIIITTRYFSFPKQNESNENKTILTKISKAIENFTSKRLTTNLKETIPLISITDNSTQTSKTETNKDNNEILRKMLASEINSIEIVDKQQEDAQINEAKENKTAEDTTTQNEIEIAQTNVETQVVTNNPLAESFNVQYGAVKIKNQTSYTLTEDMLNPDITIENKNIVLFHTHSCESYTSSEAYPYTPTGTFRTTDLNFTVTRVGTELENQLKQYGYSVVHDTSYHDYPAYNGSYTRSLQTVENILKQTPSDIIIDLHRDAIGSRSDYAPIVKIGENDVAAQMMFVIGTNAGGLWHPNWNQNLKFAIKVQQKAEEMYPGLFKPIMLTTSRYNQHTGKYASIIEVGATGNTLEQCLTSMKYLAKVMSAIV